MEILPTFSLIGAIFMLGLGVVVLLKTKRSKPGIIFCLFCISVAIWLFSTFKMLSSKEDVGAIFWDRTVYVGVVFIPTLMYHFGLVFLNIEKKQKKILLSSYFLSLFFLLISRTDYFVSGLYKYGWGAHSQAKLFHSIFIVFFFAIISLFFYNLLNALKKSSGIQKLQIRYILLSFLILNLGGVAYLPAYGINLSPLPAYLFEITGALVLAFAITKYHLFEIRIILTELLVGLIALIILSQALTAPTLWGKISGFLLLFLFSIAAYFLIKSVLKEIEQREELKIAKEKIEKALKEAEKAYEVEKKSHEELKKLDEAKSQFVLITQHHLRTPLSIMKGYVSMLLEGSYGKMNEEFIKPLKGFQISTDNLIKLVNEFLDISQLQVGSQILSPQETQIEDLITEIIQELKPEADKKHIYLEIEKPIESLPKVNIDRAKVKAALFNVIDNGMKYTLSGGVRIRFKTTDSKIKIIIEDTGIGMTKEDMDTLFTRFFTRGREAKKVYATGRGIGLYMAEQIIKAHQGRVWAESQGKDKGSTFYVELPIKS